jgi:lysophospholipase L1-like esterase
MVYSHVDVAHTHARGGGRANTGADFILVHLGTNDVGQGHTLPQMLSDMTTLLATIKAGNPGATTIVGSIINMGANDTNAVLTGFNAALPGLVKAAAVSQKVLFADVNRRSNWCWGPAGWPCTGVHPTTGGYAGMAMAWFEVLGPLMPLP